jgi:uncharacterized membrane protein
LARRKKGIPRLPVGFVELVGLGIAIFLMLISMGVLYAGEIPCPRGRLFACHSVLRGKFSHLGPFPIAHMGVLYFVVQLGLTWLMGSRMRGIGFLKAMMTLGGLGFIGYLRSIEILWLRAMCPWCLAVALAVIVEAVLLYSIFAPPLPKLGWFGRVVIVFLFFFASVGITCAAGAFIRIPKTLPPRPASTPAALPTPRPASTPQVQNGARPTQTSAPRRTPEPTRAPVRATPTPQPEDTGLLEYPDSPEGLVFRDRQWKLVADTEALMRTIDAEAPVLMLAYDPYCPVCEQVITESLADARMDLLPVTKVAIDQRELVGELSPHVVNVPTLLVVGPGGQVLFKHEGLISADDIIARVEQVLGAGR